MSELRLPGGVWTYNPDEQLGPAGGFGAVYAGEGPDHDSVAVKILTAVAEEFGARELSIAEDLADRELAHVIPVHDSGQDAISGRQVVVMARAEKSLQSELDTGRTYEEPEAVQVLLEILAGLDEVGDLVHRDLKPGNVLWHEGAWKIADFGIAKYVEDATATYTLKGCRSPHYAAPEQWRGETATEATDLYALGCIAHALVTGRPPFTGPEEQIQKAHLLETPPDLPGTSNHFQAVARLLLRKPPESRPRRGRVVSVLGKPRGAAAGGQGRARLAAAAASVGREESAEEAARAKRGAEKGRRQEIAKDAQGELREITGALVSAAEESAAGATRRQKAPFGVMLGKGVLVAGPGPPNAVPADQFPDWKWDIVASGAIRVSQTDPKYVWSASLWFGRPNPEIEYRWYEMAYRTTAGMRGRRESEPFSLEPGEDADLAAAPSLHSVDVAYGPLPIDGEDTDAFIDRWLERLGQAAVGELRGS